MARAAPLIFGFSESISSTNAVDSPLLNRRIYFLLPELPSLMGVSSVLCNSVDAYIVGSYAVDEQTHLTCDLVENSDREPIIRKSRVAVSPLSLPRQSRDHVRVGALETNFVPILYRQPGKVGILALLAERKFNNLRGINTPLEFDSVPGHHI
jgi:hypothetical protein